MQILILNAGSSSLKYTLYERSTLEVKSKGIVEKIGDSGSLLNHTWFDISEKKEITRTQDIQDHQAALELIGEVLYETVVEDQASIGAIGHRLVHGGEAFSEPVIITEEVKEKVKDLIPLAPLHNPANLLGISVSERVFPNAVQIGVFDTAFYSSIPQEIYRYALPEKYYTEFGIRVYGFHGTSHKYVSRKAMDYLENPNANLITIHLGNGASISSIKTGKAVDTSMGLSPLPGLVMGTRSGDIDPSIIFHLYHQHGYTVEQIERDLNKESGLKGLAGKTDLRDIIQLKKDGDANAKLAIDIYCYRIRKYVGSYMAALGHVDALVFTAGVGENSAEIRSETLNGLEELGIVVDENLNSTLPTGEVKEFSKPSSRVKLLVVPTDEEKQIALEVIKLTE